jgi:hypothetical protein
MKNRKSFWFWFLIGIGILLNLMYLSGQTMAIINYDFTVSTGLQESIDEITGVGVAFNKGFGLGDTVFYIPLFIAGIIGLIRGKIWGIYTMFGAMAVTVYWPIVSLSALYYAKNAPGFNFTNHSEYAVILSLIILYGLWGLWFLYRNKNKLST